MSKIDNKYLYNLAILNYINIKNNYILLKYDLDIFVCKKYFEVDILRD